LDQINAADALFAQNGPSAEVLNSYDTILLLDELDSRIRSQIHFKRALIEVTLNKMSRAISDLQKVVELDPNHKPAISKLNQLLFERGQFEGLVGTEFDGKVAEIEDMVVKANESFKNHDFPQCLALLTPVVESCPLSVEANTLHFKCSYELYVQDPHGKVNDEFTSKLVVEDLTRLVNIQPFNLHNYHMLSAMLLFTDSDFSKSNKIVKSCLRIDNEFKPCREMSKFQWRFSQFFPILEQYSILLGYYSIQLEQSASTIEEVDIDFKSVHQLLFVDPIKAPKHEKNNLGKSVKNNFDYLLETARAYPGTFTDDMMKLGCETFVQLNDYNGAKQYCDQISETFLPKQIPEIDDLMKQKKFNQAKSILELYNKNVQQTKLFKQRYGKIEDIYRQQQQQQYHQQQQQRQQQQRQYRQREQQFHQPTSKPKNDYYKLLDIPRDADEKTIKKGYRSQTLKYHPDKCGGTNLTQEKCEEKMQEINRAYEVLSDKELKSRYDRGDDPMDHTQQAQGRPQGGHQAYNFFHGQGGNQFFQQFFGGGGQGSQFHFGGGSGEGFGGFGSQGHRIKVKDLNSILVEGLVKDLGVLGVRDTE
jgi:DnaJ family protein C protein 3